MSCPGPAYVATYALWQGRLQRRDPVCRYTGCNEQPDSGQGQGLTPASGALRGPLGLGLFAARGREGVAFPERESRKSLRHLHATPLGRPQRYLAAQRSNVRAGVTQPTVH